MRLTYLISVTLFVSLPTAAGVVEDVALLIDKVEHSSCTFIRNGKRHTQQEAAEHLQRKWDYAKDDVTNIQVFIDEVATKSWFSGKPYMVECRDKTITSREWLNELWTDANGKSTFGLN